MSATKEKRMIMHMGVAKSYVRQIIAAKGAAFILKGWTGTDEEALQALRDDPREIFCSCDCPKNSRGACTGRTV